MASPGGGYFAWGLARQRWSTIVANTAPAGANVSTTSLESYATVVGLRRGGGGDCRGVNPPTNSLGYNMDGDNSCGFRRATDRAPSNPLLGALANNGRTTQTRLPQAGSPLVSVIPPNVQICDDRGDQRGVVRPRGAACDIGSVER